KNDYRQATGCPSDARRGPVIGAAKDLPARPRAASIRRRAVPAFVAASGDPLRPRPSNALRKFQRFLVSDENQLPKAREKTATSERFGGRVSSTDAHELVVD